MGKIGGGFIKQKIDKNPVFSNDNYSYILYEAVAGLNKLHFKTPEVIPAVPTVITGGLTTQPGSTLTNLNIDMAIFITQTTEIGMHAFTYEETDWFKNGEPVVLSTYGITVDGTPTTGDFISATLTVVGSPEISPSYTFVINKGDGTEVTRTIDTTTIPADITLDYAEAGTYTITLKNDIPSIQLATNYNAQKSDALKYKEVYLGKNHDTVIPDYAFTFYGVDSSIETIRKIIAPYVTELGASSIYYCYAMTELNIKNVTTISDYYTLNDCNVSILKLPNLIGPYFSNGYNENMDEIILPKFTGQFTGWAKIARLPKATSIYQFRGSELHLGEDSVTLSSRLYDADGNTYGIDMNIRIYVPKNRVAYYKTAYKWSTYAKYIFPEVADVQTTSFEDKFDGNIQQYIGETTEDYSKGKFYKQETNTVETLFLTMEAADVINNIDDFDPNVDGLWTDTSTSEIHPFIITYGWGVKYDSGELVIINSKQDFMDVLDIEDIDLPYTLPAELVIYSVVSTVDYKLVSTQAVISDTNVTVAVEDWVADTTYTGYGFKADITLNGITSDYSGEIIFGLTEAISGNYAPIASTGTDIITIYAVAVPSADITLPLVKGELL